MSTIQNFSLSTGRLSQATPSARASLIAVGRVVKLHFGTAQNSCATESPWLTFCVVLCQNLRNVCALGRPLLSRNVM